MCYGYDAFDNDDALDNYNRTPLHIASVYDGQDKVAQILLDKGAKVCISDVNEEKGLKTAEEFGRTYGKSEVTFKLTILKGNCPTENESCDLSHTEARHFDTVLHEPRVLVEQPLNSC